MSQLGVRHLDFFAICRSLLDSCWERTSRPIEGDTGWPLAEVYVLPSTRLVYSADYAERML